MEENRAGGEESWMRAEGKGAGREGSWWNVGKKASGGKLGRRYIKGRGGI